MLGTCTPFNTFPHPISLNDSSILLDIAIFSPISAHTGEIKSNVIIALPPEICLTLAPTEVDPTFNKSVSSILISVTDSGFLLPNFCFTPKSLVNK